MSEVKTFNDRIAANKAALTNNGWPTKACDKCEGNGWVNKDRCPKCEGIGTVTNRNMRPEQIAEWWSRNGQHDYLGATLLYPQDRMPYLVTSTSKSGKTITIRPLRSVGGDLGYMPARYDGEFPVWDHDYNQQDMRQLSDGNINPDVDRSARWSEKNGCYMAQGSRIKVGVANYHRNYSY